MEITNFDFRQMVSVKDDEVTTTSFKVAEYFGKAHKDVIRAIKNLNCSKEFAERNFALCFKINRLQNYKKQPYYRMTKDGCIFLIMGFTGKKATAIKEAYIKAFNAMAEYIKKSKICAFREFNQTLVRFESEKQLASKAGKALNRWGKKVKPRLVNKIKEIADKMQLDFFD